MSTPVPITLALDPLVTAGIAGVVALGLGIAFRNKPADVIAIGVVTGSPAGDSLAGRLSRSTGF